MTVIRPLDAPDEPAHLEAIMQVRKEHKLPEVHFTPGNRVGEIIGSPSDAETRAYILKRRSKLPVNNDYVVLPYKSVQPPLYYVAAGLVAQLVPADPRTVLYVGWQLENSFRKHRSWRSLRLARSRCSRNSVLPMRTLPMTAQ
jgi:hypothetical protein